MIAAGTVNVHLALTRIYAGKKLVFKWDIATAHDFFDTLLWSRPERTDFTRPDEIDLMEFIGKPILFGIEEFEDGNGNFEYEADRFTLDLNAEDVCAAEGID